MKPAVAFVILAVTTSISAASTNRDLLMSCALGNAHDQVVDVLATDREGDTLTVTLRPGRLGRPSPLFPSEELDDSRGTSIRVQCVGKTENVLVITGEFYGSGYPRGLVLRYNGGKLQRLEFAEHSLPRFIYLGSRDMRLYVSQAYPGRQRGWTVYRYDATRGQYPEQEFVTKLPDAGTDQKIILQ